LAADFDLLAANDTLGRQLQDGDLPARRKRTTVKPDG
jgi:hypothetical protein